MFPSSTDVIILLLTVRKTNRERTIKGNIVERYREERATINHTNYQLLSSGEKIGNHFYLKLYQSLSINNCVLSVYVDRVSQNS